MELRQLRYFVAICEEGSLTRAGARLHIAQQSLSQTIAALESELGVRLLERGAFGVRTTSAGRVLQEKGSALLRDADAAARAVQQAAGTASGHVKVRYGLDSEHFVEQLLRRLQAAVPDITITGWTGPDTDNLRAVRAGEADLVVAWAVTGHVGDLHTAAIAEEHCWAAVPSDHHLAGREFVPVEALAGQPMVMFPRAAAPWVFDHIIAHVTADGRLAPRIIEAPVSGQSGMIDQALRLGAPTPVSRSLLPSLQRPAIRFLPFQPPLTVPLDLVWRGDSSSATTAVVHAATSNPPGPHDGSTRERLGAPA